MYLRPPLLLPPLLIAGRVEYDLEESAGDGVAVAAPGAEARQRRVVEVDPVLLLLPPPAPAPSAPRQCRAARGALRPRGGGGGRLRRAPRGRGGRVDEWHASGRHCACRRRVGGVRARPPHAAADRRPVAVVLSPPPARARTVRRAVARVGGARGAGLGLARDVVAVGAAEEDAAGQRGERGGEARHVPLVLLHRRQPHVVHPRLPPAPPPPRARWPRGGRHWAGGGQPKPGTRGCRSAQRAGGARRATRVAAR